MPASVPRNGLPLGAMSAGQRRLALALLRSSSSQAGYRKALDIMALQGVLRRMSTGLSDPFDPDLYYVSVFEEERIDRDPALPLRTPKKQRRCRTRSRW